MTDKYINISKFLSYVLRHDPGSIDLQMDSQGWADIADLIHKTNASDQGITLTPRLLQQVVETSDKKRFTISEDGKNIRAAQGHSIGIDLQLTPVAPPDILYHGTASRFLDKILKEGLKPQQRQYVHLSSNIETATAVGQRYGKPLILAIKARQMNENGYKFYLSENGIWLVNDVPPSFIRVDD